MDFLSPAAYLRLRQQRVRSNGDAGGAWVDGLDILIGEMVERWSLSAAPPFQNLSYNYAAPVRTREGEPAVLKMSLPDHNFLCEAEALAAFDGVGAARLLRVDRDVGAMLVERLEPGTELQTLEDEAAETSAVAGVMRELQRPYGGLFPFPHASDWIDEALSAIAVPKLKTEHAWIERALDRLTEVAAERREEVLLHGDLHHGNVLSAHRAPWLAIDPKGVIGDPAWEVAPFLFNRLGRYPSMDRPAIVRRRADQMAEELELDRERVYAWSAVRALQAAFWSLRDEPSARGRVLEGALVCAEELSLYNTPG